MSQEPWVKQFGACEPSFISNPKSWTSTRHVIMHHFSMELLFNLDSVIIPIFKHWLPLIHGFPSFTLQSSSNSLHHTAINQHVQFHDLKSVFKGHLWYWDGKTSPSPNVPSSFKQSLWSLKSTWSTIWQEQYPIMALPVVPQLTPTAPTVVSQPSVNDIALCSYLLLTPLFPPHIWTPKTIFLWGGILQ